MLKFGVTYLKDGVWQGQQVVPAEWVELSATPYRKNRSINTPGGTIGLMGYGYSLWTKRILRPGIATRFFAAGGWGGQEIIVLPEHNAVVVFTGGNYAVTARPFTILRRHILPALE